MALTHFNPRSRGGSDERQAALEAYRLISIHAPAEGATGKDETPVVYPPISIHAPAEGATISARPPAPTAPDFNPRSRGGSDMFPFLFSGQK